MRKKKKSQHYVPRLLLRKFALPGSTSKVGLLLLKSGLFPPPARIRNQCKQDYFYGKDPAVEDGLSVLETLAGAVVKEVIETRSLPDFGTEDWQTMADFIAVQFGRTPAANKRANAYVKAKLRDATIMGLPGTENLRPSDIEGGKIERVNGPALSVAEALDLSPKLWDLKDLLVVNECSANFVLPDIGVIIHNEWARGARSHGAAGLSSHGIQVMLPLSPKLLWLKYDSDVYMCPQNTRVVSTQETDDIIKFNRLAIAHAEETVCFPGDVATQVMLIGIGTGLRAPRSAAVRSKQNIVSEERKTQFITYHEMPNVPFDVPWMPLWPEAASIPVPQRAGRMRPLSMSTARYSEARGGNQMPAHADRKKA